MNSLLEWVDNRTEKLVVGVFLDISGAFDNLKWDILFEDLVNLGANEHSIHIIKSYLENRKAHVTIEGATASCVLSKGCPQGSLITDRIIEWAEARGLNFSSQKTQVITLKGGLKPGYTISFGNEAVVSRSPVKYLGVYIDYKRNYWEHLQEISKKSDSMYTRMRSATSANWGLKQTTSKIIYKSVFIPRLGYAVSIWDKSLTTNKAVKLLGSKQRQALISATGAYKTTSTDALQVTAGCLPLDLELRLMATKEKVRLGKLQNDSIERTEEEILQIWHERWTNSTKGRWTFEWFPVVKVRYRIPMELDHFVTQFITGHGDFNEKLHGFKLKGSPLCECGEPESAKHILFECPRVNDQRNILKEKITREGESWPCEVNVFVRTRTRFEALRQFAKSALNNRTDR